MLSKQFSAKPVKQLKQIYFSAKYDNSPLFNITIEVNIKKITI